MARDDEKAMRHVSAHEDRLGLREAELEHTGFKRIRFTPREEVHQEDQYVESVKEAVREILKAGRGHELTGKIVVGTMERGRKDIDVVLVLSEAGELQLKTADGKILPLDRDVFFSKDSEKLIREHTHDK